MYHKSQTFELLRTLPDFRTIFEQVNEQSEVASGGIAH